jgi:polysaccharide deacetylase family protein (PEP-CTERM system associated)
MAINNAFTVDVEEHFQVAALKSAFDVDDWSKQDSRVERNTDRILQILDEEGVKGTFFVLGWVADRVPGVVTSIVDGGHELACHGYSHQLIYDQAPDTFREETFRAKRVLEDVSGRAVNGYRAASYSITARSLWALQTLIEAGFSYDSSIVPARHDLYGIAGAPIYPYRLSLPGVGDIVEFPPSTIGMAGMRMPIGGGGFFRLYPYAFTRWGMNRINRRAKQPVSFYLHPWEVDVEQPRVKTNWKSNFRHYNNLDKCEPRLKRVLKDFRFSPMREVLADLELPRIEMPELAA